MPTFREDLLSGGVRGKVYVALDSHGKMSTNKKKVVYLVENIVPMDQEEGFNRSFQSVRGIWYDNCQRISSQGLIKALQRCMDDRRAPENWDHLKQEHPE